MDNDDGMDLKKVGIIAGSVAAASAVGYGAYYVFWRWIYNPAVTGEGVLASNAPELLAVWRYYQWKGACDRKTFKRVLQEPLSVFFTKTIVGIIHKNLQRMVGQEEGGDLRRSQILDEHPWIDKFVADIGNLLEERVSVELPEHFCNQAFRLFDADADGTITKQEFVAKCNILTTEGRDQRITALFSLVDEDQDGLIVEAEVQRVLADVAQLIHEAAPQVLTQVSNILVERLVHHVYDELKIVPGHVIPAERMSSFLLGLRKSLPNAALSSLLEGMIKENVLDSKGLFRKYSQNIENGEGIVEPVITPNMFNKLLEEILDLDEVFKAMDSWLPVATHEAGNEEQLSRLRDRLRERFVGEKFSISDLLFRALDLDNSGNIDQTELEGFIELLHHTASFAGSNKANDLSQSYTGVALAQLNTTGETEVQHVMHVLAKKRRVTNARLTGLIEAIISLYKSFLEQYIDVYLCKEARDNELKAIVHTWFHKISDQKDAMNIKAFALNLGNIVSIFD